MNTISLQKKIFGLLILVPLFLAAQTTTEKKQEQIKMNFAAQINLFPHEKIYLHTDKATYLSGERIWFRAFLVDGVFHQPVNESKYVYVELADPLGSIVNKVTVKADTNDIFSGYLLLNDNLPLGDYTLLAYTKFITNSGEDYVFKKKIKILTPEAASIRTGLTVDTETRNRIHGNIFFRDPKGNRITDNNNVKIKFTSTDEFVKLQSRDKHSFSFSADPAEINRHSVLVEAGKYKEFIPLVAHYNDFDVAFMPEGGNLLSGRLCRVAFKAINKSGLHENIQGVIVDENNDTITAIHSSHSGMGIFELKSRSGAKYYAICQNEYGNTKRIELPSAVTGTYSLSVNFTPGKAIVYVQNSDDVAFGNNPLYLLIHTRGDIKYLEKWNHNNPYISLNTAELPSGVSQILLLDGNMQPVSERLVFCNNHDKDIVEVLPDKQKYGPRNRAKIQVKLGNKRGLRSDGSFSVSVTDNNDVKQDDTNTILSRLLLGSELKGYIESPSYYLQKGNHQAADLLMMTQGWRKYDVASVIAGKFEEPIIPFEQSQSIEGLVEGGEYKKGPEKDAAVNIFFPESGNMDIAVTDKNGRFIFDGLIFQDSTHCLVQARNSKNRLNENYVLKLANDYNNKLEFTPVPAYYAGLSNKESEAPAIEYNEYIVKADKKYLIENGIRSVFLDEVTVRAKVRAKEREYENSTFFYKYANYKIPPDVIEKMNPRNYEDIFNGIAGIFIKKDRYGRSMITIRSTPSASGANPALIIVNDMPMTSDFRLEDINIHDIESVGVFKGASTAAILGTFGGGGAVVINTKKGRSFSNQDNLKSYAKQVYLHGFQKPAEFYSPKYDTAEKLNSKDPDLRTTIFWKPDVFFDAGGNAFVDFYMADTETTYSVVIEGVTSDGRIIYNKSNISIGL